jgi:hypothetical protein
VKRGWIAWDETELPRVVFATRLEALRLHLEDSDVAAAVIYTDVWRSNRVRYFSNFMPYWNRALLVVPHDSQPVLLCALSPRVYPWIRSATILEDIHPSPNLPKALEALAAERSWKRIGVLDLSRLPSDIQFSPGLEVIDLFFAHVPDEWELAMHRKAAQIARDGLGEELPNAVGQIDHAFAARLEKRFRRAGAEDLVVLLTNGLTVPAPARGETLGKDFSLVLALEYRGHWVRIARSASRRDPFPGRIHVENLSGPYPFEPAARLESPAIMALRFESQTQGLRLFHGDTYHSSDQGLELL